MENDILKTGGSRALKAFYFVSFVLMVLVFRLFWLQLVRHDFYREISFDQRLRSIILSPDRGDIYDRSGNVLATSIDSYSVFAVPASIKNKKEVSSVLAGMLGVGVTSVFERINVNKPFVWVKRKIEEPVAKKIMAKGIKGIGFLQEKKRVYPKKTLAAQVIGFVGTDNQGLTGIELSFERYLKGQEGRLITEKDVGGRDILTSSLRTLTAPSDGMDLTLTIDEPIQYIAENSIREMVESSNALSGSVIVMDIRSGDILALASYPTFDPNDYQRYNMNVWVNRAVTDVYEPGSTFKLVTVASALDEGTIKRDTKVYCADSLEIGGRIIRNSHKLDFGKRYLSIDEILCQSVNVGAAQIAMKMGKDRFYQRIRDFGFGQPTAVGLPGESRGILNPPSSWNKPDIAMIGFGQSIAVTPIQLITCLSAIANKGMRIEPILVKRIESPDKAVVKVFEPAGSARAVSEKTADEVLGLSEKVVLKGTGKSAQIAGFRVGGKTGTAQKPRPGGGGYMDGRYISSFIGFAPLSDPRISVLVMVDDPKPVFWGERIAAPVFKKVMEFTLRRLSIAPDKISNPVI